MGLNRAISFFHRVFHRSEYTFSSRLIRGGNDWDIDVSALRAEGNGCVLIACQSTPMRLTEKPGQNVKDVCTLAAHEAGISNIIVDLFTLVSQDGKHFLNFKKELTSKAECLQTYQFRLTFKVCRASQLQEYDLDAFIYYFHQCRKDFLDGLITEFKGESNEKCFITLVIVEVIYRAKERNVVPSKVLESPKTYGVHTLMKRGIFKEYSLKEVKLYLKKKLGDFQKLGDISLMAEFLHAIEKAEDFFVHKFTVKKIYRVASQSGHRQVEKEFELLISAVSGIKKRSTICLPEGQINYAEEVVKDFSEVKSLKLDEEHYQVTIFRKDSIPEVLNAFDLRDAQSILAIIEGYYRLLVNRNINLRDTGFRDNPTSIHGPIIREKAISLLQEQGMADGLFLIREKRKEIGTYVLSLCHKEKAKHYEIAFEQGKYFLEKTNMKKEFTDIESLVKYYKETKDGLPVCLGVRCLPKTLGFAAQFDGQPVVPITSRPLSITDYRFEKIDPTKLEQKERLKKRGEFGFVYKVLWRLPDEDPVDVVYRELKKIDNMDFCKVAEKMVELKHPNVVRFYGIAQMSRSNAVVIEHVPMGPLDEYLLNQCQRRGGIGKDWVILRAAKVAEGMMFLQGRNCVHGRLSAHNVLVTSDECVKISDVGLLDFRSHGAEFKHEIKDEIDSGYCWHAPEVMRMQGSFTHQSDVWSLGVTMWEMFSLKKPYHGNTSPKPLLKQEEILARYHRRLYLNTNRRNLPKQVAEIIHKCWNTFENERISFEEIATTLYNLANGSMPLDKTSDVLVLPDLEVLEDWEEELIRKSQTTAQNLRMMSDDSYSGLAPDQSVLNEGSSKCTSCLTGPHTHARPRISLYPSHTITNKPSLHRTFSDPGSPPGGGSEEVDSDFTEALAAQRKTSLSRTSSYPMASGVDHCTRRTSSQSSACFNGYSKLVNGQLEITGANITNSCYQQAPVADVENPTEQEARLHMPVDSTSALTYINQGTVGQLVSSTQESDPGISLSNRCVQNVNVEDHFVSAEEWIKKDQPLIPDTVFHSPKGSKTHSYDVTSDEHGTTFSPGEEISVEEDAMNFLQQLSKVVEEKSDSSALKETVSSAVKETNSRKQPQEESPESATFTHDLEDLAALVGNMESVPTENAPPESMHSQRKEIGWTDCKPQDEFKGCKYSSTLDQIPSFLTCESPLTANSVTNLFGDDPKDSPENKECIVISNVDQNVGGWFMGAINPAATDTMPQISSIPQTNVGYVTLPTENAPPESNGKRSPRKEIGWTDCEPQGEFTGFKDVSTSEQFPLPFPGSPFTSTEHPVNSPTANSVTNLFGDDPKDSPENKECIVINNVDENVGGCFMGAINPTATDTMPQISSIPQTNVGYVTLPTENAPPESNGKRSPRKEIGWTDCEPQGEFTGFKDVSTSEQIPLPFPGSPFTSTEHPVKSPTANSVTNLFGDDPKDSPENKECIVINNVDENVGGCFMGAINPTATDTMPQISSIPQTNVGYVTLPTENAPPESNGKRSPRKEIGWTDCEPQGEFTGFKDVSTSEQIPLPFPGSPFTSTEHPVKSPTANSVTNLFGDDPKDSPENKECIVINNVDENVGGCFMGAINPAATDTMPQISSIPQTNVGYVTLPTENAPPESNGKRSPRKEIGWTDCEPQGEFTGFKAISSSEQILPLPFPGSPFMSTENPVKSPTANSVTNLFGDGPKDSPENKECIVTRNFDQNVGGLFMGAINPTASDTMPQVSFIPQTNVGCLTLPTENASCEPERRNANQKGEGCLMEETNLKAFDTIPNVPQASSPSQANVGYIGLPTENALQESNAKQSQRNEVCWIDCKPQDECFPESPFTFSDSSVENPFSVCDGLKTFQEDIELNATSTADQVGGGESIGVFKPDAFDADKDRPSQPNDGNSKTEKDTKRSKELLEQKIPAHLRIVSGSLRTEEQIGKGNFGWVLKGILSIRGKGGQVKETEVAVKVLKPNVEEKDKEDFLTEAENMIKIANIKSENIIKLIGIQIGQDEEMMIVTELAPLSDLPKYLTKSKILAYGDRTLLKTYKLADKLGIPELLEYCLQISKGMTCLEEWPLVHRDLAARNILVTREDRVKISDFGLSRLNDYYKTTRGKWPTKWYAPECLEKCKFTSSSDVWSFGVTMWEIFLYGERRPYPDIDASHILEHIQGGNRLPCPENCPEDIYKIMKKCWNSDPKLRPSFFMLSNSHLPKLQREYPVRP